MTTALDVDVKEVKVTTVSSFDEVSALYHDIQKRNDQPLMNSFVWLNTWYKNYWQDQWQLHCFIIYQNDKLIAIAPFYMQKYTRFPFLKSLHLIGQGEPEIKEVASEYLDVNIKGKYHHELYPKIADAITKIDFDILVVSAILKDSHIANIAKMLSENLQIRHCCRYLVNRETWQKKTISKNTRSRIKRSNNQLNQLNAEVRWFSNDEIKCYWPALKEFHQKRWHKCGQSGAFLSQEFNKFHLSLIEKNKDSVAMSGIFVNDAPIAINYYLVDETTYYFYQSGWDEENYAKLSPGLYLHYWSIEHCPHQYYDFMMGSLKDSYKAKFAGDNIPMQSLLYIKNKPKYFLSQLAMKLKHKLRW
ncbi:GNAT family N-acetyltransferase [Colwellia sp. Bg11-12]|uniref:GNAT family N-acetyltransferase n=1 Tax=Colwellia sp. Bg11-12 TaxID=2759817 RepID=UPI0015F75A88|nr:GNAT family N-acetyltransferase [Colwellia sp. Bg11-12]MBA6265143.1 GNAT family N-acetyltransferase [Colwellia sp. Bg11-12]